MDYRTILNLFYAEHGSRKQLVVEKGQGFEKWQKWLLLKFSKTIVTESGQTMADFSAEIQSAKRNVDHFLGCIYKVSNQFQVVLSKHLKNERISKVAKMAFLISKATVRGNAG